MRRDEPGSACLSRLVGLIPQKAEGESACREAILQRLDEVLMIETMRLHAAERLGDRQPGLVAGRTVER